MLKDRLVVRQQNGDWMVKTGENTWLFIKAGSTQSQTFGMVFSGLAAYEDTGYTPEEVATMAAELLEAREVARIITNNYLIKGLEPHIEALRDRLRAIAGEGSEG